MQPLHLVVGKVERVGVGRGIDRCRVVGAFPEFQHRAGVFDGGADGGTDERTVIVQGIRFGAAGSEGEYTVLDLIREILVLVVGVSLLDILQSDLAVVASAGGDDLRGLIHLNTGKDRRYGGQYDEYRQHRHHDLILCGKGVFHHFTPLIQPDRFVRCPA